MTQFLRDQASDSEEVVRPLMLDGSDKGFGIEDDIEDRFISKF